MMTHRPGCCSSSSSSSTLKKFSVSDRAILDRRVKANPRYAAVQPRTNTGFNTHRRQELDKEIRKYYKVRNDEEFRRISLGDLIQLMVTHSIDTAAVAAEAEEEEEEEEEGEEKGKKEEEEVEEEEDDEEMKVPLRHRDQLRKVLHGMEHLMARGSQSPPPRPYLIMDVRTPQEYTDGHIATAVSHPTPRLSRAVGWECNALLTHKNRPGAIIVVCDECEDAAPSAVSTLQHRGYTNALMLSGGVRLVRDKIGPPFVTTDSAMTELPLSLAIALQHQLESLVLPPLTMSDGAQWWAASSAAGRGGGGVSVRSGTQRSLDPPLAAPPRPPPWR
ncbi:centrosomal protein of 41 kDa-like [Eriocheir sinensis]|uniref:centrosomal protein of 41 kDa-like n=1 Tax=Eriocheir sinensis TaxID=95602 RepID=UPI0021C9FD26|nr:centrosomal protein of 41 kDa-like [Eriocheir sinensis]XP_050732239.1 centrosomal protein of 41 kDa-like [Eriocheir sinensis]